MRYKDITINNYEQKILAFKIKYKYDNIIDALLEFNFINGIADHQCASLCTPTLKRLIKHDAQSFGLINKDKEGILNKLL